MDTVSFQRTTYYTERTVLTQLLLSFCPPLLLWPADEEA